LEVKVEDPIRMARVYAVEHGISPRFVDLAVASISNFSQTEEGKDFEWTLYDIMQVFTSIAHDPRVKENMRMKLQGLGGHMVAQSANEHRCEQCSHLLTT
jgi:hypothetical protein